MSESVLSKVIGQTVIQKYQLSNREEAREHLSRLGFVALGSDDRSYTTKKKLAVILNNGLVHVYNRKDVGV